MRRLMAAAALVPVFVLAIAGQAFAAIPPGTDRVLVVTNEHCSGTICVRTTVTGFTNQNHENGPMVCASEFAHETDTGFTDYQFHGCATVAPTTFTVDSRGYLVGIAATVINEIEDIHDPSLGSRTVTVSASAQTSGKVQTQTIRFSQADGACTDNITQKDQIVDVVGTLTQDTTTLAVNVNGTSMIAAWSVRVQCPH